MLNESADWRRVAVSSGATAVVLATAVQFLGDGTRESWLTAGLTWLLVSLAAAVTEYVAWPRRTRRPPG